jgi:hypothetical protein
MGRIKYVFHEQSKLTVFKMTGGNKDNCLELLIDYWSFT